MKVFISMPMRGKTYEEVVEDFEAIREIVHKLFPQAKIIDSVLDREEGWGRAHYLAESIKLLADADVVVMHPYWEGASGCLIEHEVAEEYGKPILILPEERLL